MYGQGLGREIVRNIQTATEGVITLTAVTGQNIFITGLKGYIDTAAGDTVITNSGAVLFEHRGISTSGGGMNINYQFNPALRTTGVGQTLTATINGTASAALTVTGYRL